MRAVLAAAVFAILPLSACAASSYPGIPLALGAADPQVQDLARRALAGDKQAQLDLGIRLEEGRGVAPNPALAASFYAQAAAPTRRVLHIYSPPLAKGRAGRVIAVDTGRTVPGLAAASARLASIRARLGQLP